MLAGFQTTDRFDPDSRPLRQLLLSQFGFTPQQDYFVAKHNPHMVCGETAIGIGKRQRKQASAVRADVTAGHTNHGVNLS